MLKNKHMLKQFADRGQVSQYPAETIRSSGPAILQLHHYAIQGKAQS